MKKILVPVDFSAHTQIACTYAIEMADVRETEIILFHTYFDHIIITDTSFPDTLNLSSVYNEELLRDIHQRALSMMEDLHQKVVGNLADRGLINISVRFKVTGGEIEHELGELCKDLHPDLVVMGTTGRGNTLQVWGKVSSFIIDHARVPVITVPAIRHFRGFENLMFAADLSDSNEHAIRTMKSLFASFHSKMHVVHFVPKLKAGDAFIKMKALQLKFSDEVKNNHFSFQVIEYEEDNQHAIDLFVAHNQIDLIGFQPHKRSLLSMLFTKKITRKNLFETNIPMVAVPAQ